jgi:anti-sigma B factor antagonist
MQTLAIEGKLTLITLAELKTSLLAFLRTGDELKINLSKVSEFDSAGFQLLIQIKRKAAQSGKKLRFEYQGLVRSEAGLYH